MDEVEKAVVGKREALELLLLGVLADGHVLIEDYPGLAKTLMARSFARATSLDFSRIQFTPDLMPSDVTGSSIFNQRDADFEFRPGPIFANLLLADEINRAPPKTQAALLEAMQERQVTTEGETRRLGPPFLVLATQNPIEYEGTYPLPEAQLDRFLLRMSVGYPSREDEWQVLAGRAERGRDEVELTDVVDRETLLAMQAACEEVYVSEPVGLYMVDIVAATRDAQSIQVGASPRGSLALMKLSRCRAALDGRDYVTPDDVKSVAVPALAHRLTLRPELWVQRVSAEDVVQRAARHRADARSRRPRARLTRYATRSSRRTQGISAVGLLTALVTRPPGARRADGAVPARARGRARARDAAAAERRRRRSTRQRALEGDEVGARVTLELDDAGRPARRLRPPPGRRRRSPTGATPSRCTSPQAGERRELELTLLAQRWGGHVIGPTYVRARDPLGLLDLGDDGGDPARAARRTRARTCSSACSRRPTRRCSPATRSRARRARGSSSRTSARGAPATR